MLVLNSLASPSLALLSVITITITLSASARATHLRPVVTVSPCYRVMMSD